MIAACVISLRNIFKCWASLHAEILEMAVMFFPFHSLCDYLSTVTGFEVDKVWPTTCTRGHFRLLLCIARLR